MLKDGDHWPTGVRGAALRWGPNVFDFWLLLDLNMVCGNLYSFCYNSKFKWIFSNLFILKNHSFKKYILKNYKTK